MLSRRLKQKQYENFIGRNLMHAELFKLKSLELLTHIYIINVQHFFKKKLVCMKASGQSLGVTCRGGEKGVSLILSRQESIHFPSLAQLGL